MKLISLAKKPQQHRSRFHWMHICLVRDMVQPELVQALATPNSLKKFVSFAMKYVYATPMLVTRVN